MLQYSQYMIIIEFIPLAIPGLQFACMKLNLAYSGVPGMHACFYKLSCTHVGPTDIYLKCYFILYPLQESSKSFSYSPYIMGKFQITQLFPFYYGRVLSHLVHLYYGIVLSTFLLSVYHQRLHSLCSMVFHSTVHQLYSYSLHWEGYDLELALGCTVANPGFIKGRFHSNTDA